MKRFENSNSGSGQEPFVLNMLNEKQNGYYVEVGAGDYKEGSNTYLLETEYNWVGLSLDIDESTTELYNKNRKNKCINYDATTFNFDKYFEENNFPKQIDFLQIDVDDIPQYVALHTLLNIPFSRYKFSIISFEHGEQHQYKNKKIMDLSREILDSYDYELVVRDVSEDIWVDPRTIDRNDYQHYRGIINRTSRYTDMISR